MTGFAFPSAMRGLTLVVVPLLGLTARRAARVEGQEVVSADN